MKSPIGRNAQFWSNFVGHSVHKMPVVNKKLMLQRVYNTYFGIRTSWCAQKIALCALRTLLPDFA